MNDQTLNQAINMGIDVFYIDAEKNKTTKINATPGAGGKWDFTEVCTADPETCADHDHNMCDRCLAYTSQIADHAGRMVHSELVKCPQCGLMPPGATNPAIPICGDCALIAYDNGVDESLMVTLGSDSEDHDCIYYLEPEDRALPGNRCACSCHPAIK